LEKFPLKNSVEKFPLKNQTLPGQSPRVKRNEKPYPPRVKITGVDKILPSLDGILG